MGENEPLFVIDGMAIQTVDGSLYGISPGDVESISVLKDASATGVYGSRGANGVILINTKRRTN
jgi:TonB-dependent SusC/RagA subfamily outer membrane receptor